MDDKICNVSIDVEAAFEQCGRKCPYFEIEQEGVVIFDIFGRGLPVYKPHCKNMYICQNAVKIAAGESGNQNGDS